MYLIKLKVFKEVRISIPSNLIRLYILLKNTLFFKIIADPHNKDVMKRLDCKRIFLVGK